MPLIFNVVAISGFARKSLRKMPHYISDKLQMWIESIEKEGLEEVKKLPSYHDELYRKEDNQRSIRLGRGYKAIYEIQDNGVIEVVDVLGDKDDD